MRRDWIEKRLAELRPYGKTKAGLADAMGIPPTRIAAVISGDRKKIPASEIHGLASYLDMDGSEVVVLLSGGAIRPAALEPVYVIGAVQAGMWREAVEWPVDRQYVVLQQKMRKYAHLPQFGLEVIGPSMNRHYPEGSVVICVNLIHLRRDAVPGERVVCYRTSDQGIEATVKELRQDDKGDYWLWPISDHPNFQQPWRLPKPGEHNDNEDVRITALVIYSLKSEA